MNRRTVIEVVLFELGGVVFAGCEPEILAGRADQQRVGDGAGLGLSIVRTITIARAHEGDVSLEAIAAGGLAVRVTLPASTAV